MSFLAAARLSNNSVSKNSSRNRLRSASACPFWCLRELPEDLWPGDLVAHWAPSAPLVALGTSIWNRANLFKPIGDPFDIEVCFGVLAGGEARFAPELG